MQMHTPGRIHVGLEARNLEKTLFFYQGLFNTNPSKKREDYARFEVVDSPLNLAINQVKDPHPATRGSNHFGLQLESLEAVQEVRKRLEKLGIQTGEEKNVTCCYALQTKFWVSDPDGNRWEVYVLLDDEQPRDGVESSDGKRCCA